MDDLQTALNDATPEDPGSVRTAVSAYETALDSGSNSYPGSRTLRWRYYRPLADLLDATARQQGWAVFESLLATYSPRDRFGVPACSHVLANGIGRFVIRTRLQEHVGAVPEAALRYLRAFSGSSDHPLARQEAWTYGWGIGHPDHPVADYLSEIVEDEPRWVRSALEVAIYADQRAATDLLERLLTDDGIEFAVELTPGETVSKERFLLECLVGSDNEFRPLVPRYWEWWDEFGFAFEWDPSVRSRLRTLVTNLDTGLDLPSEWTFQDLRY